MCKCASRWPNGKWAAWILLEFRPRRVPGCWPTMHFHLFPSFQDGHEQFPNHPSSGSSPSGQLDAFFPELVSRAFKVSCTPNIFFKNVGWSNCQDHSKPIILFLLPLVPCQGSDGLRHPDVSPDAAGTAGSFTNRLVRLRYVIVRPPQVRGSYRWFWVNLQKGDI